MPSEYRTTRRIEFADTDMAGIAHFSCFILFMEEAEHEFLRSLGLSVHMQHEGDILSWPRLKTSCEFFRPAFFEDVLDIHLQIEHRGQKSLGYRFDFYRQDEHVAWGQLKVACCICNPGEKIRAVPVPSFIAEKIDG